jgi:GPI ethanolamine phosphate transferase 3 subunit O
MVNQKSISSASGLVLTIAVVVMWLLALHAASIYSFTTGFFLTRYEVKNFSDSDPVSVPGQFSKAVIIVIDALRFDFALHNFSLQEPYAMPYTNRIPSIFETLRDEQEHSFLFRFVADPPTTTMQVRDFEKKTIFRCDFPLRSIDRRALNFSNRKS